MKYVTSALSNRFDHPLLAATLILAGVFAGLGITVELLFDNGVAAGFFGVYAIITALLAGIGLAIIYLVKYASQMRDKSAPHAG